MVLVDQRPEPQRVEIELTSHEPSARRSRMAGMGHEQARGGAEPEAVSATGSSVTPEAERHRLLLGGSLIVVVVVLIAGVIVGRLGDAQSSGTDGEAVASETRAPTPARSAPVERGEIPPAVDTPVAPSPPTVRTDPSEVGESGRNGDSDVVVERRIDVHPAVSAVGVEVVALTSRGEAVRIDTATGAIVSVDVAGAQFGPPTVFAGDGWILVPSSDGVRGSTVLFDDGTRSSIDTGFAWTLLTTGEGDTFWRGDVSPGGALPDRLVEMAIDGSRTGSEIDLRGFIPRMLDPLGGVVVDAPGGSYVLTAESATRLTSGRALAVGRQRQLVHECDELLDCGYFVVERATGERRALTLDPELEELPTFELTAGREFQSPWNGPEDAVLILGRSPAGSGTQSYWLLDLVDGGYTEIGETGDVPTARWSDDQSLFWLDRGRLRWFDRATGESVLFSEELGNLNAFTLRFTPDG